MKKSNLITLLLTTITTFFLMSGLTFAQGDGHSLDAADGSPTDAVYVDNEGRVGIGTTNPQTAFDVNSVSIFRNRIAIGSSGSLPVINSGSAGIWLSPTAGDYGFFEGLADTTSGSEKWGVYSNYVGAFRLVMDKNGNVGIGTTAPSAKLSFANLNDGRNTADGITWYNPDPQSYGIFRSAGAWSSPNYQQLTLKWATGIVIDGGSAYGKSGTILQPNGGNVGIGTSSPQSKLAVNGKITAEEVEVITNVAAAEFKVKDTSWSDFVFEDNYNLPSLDKVETYIKENKHLPDIPSAKQVEEEGLSVSDMLAKQMQKIEELTLYMIEQNKRLDNVIKENQELKEQIKELAELKK